MRELVLDTRKIVDMLNNGIDKTNILGLKILESNMDTEEDMEGDSSENNFGLSIFENALDWRIGMLAIAIVKTAIKDQKHYTMRIGIDGKGDIYSAKSGRKLEY